ARWALALGVRDPGVGDVRPGRWLGRGCRTSYPTEFNPPAVANACDVCGGQLYQRPDDKREVVANRVAVYLHDTLPVIDRYASQGILHCVDGNRSIDAVQESLLEVVADPEPEAIAV